MPNRVSFLYPIFLRYRNEIELGQSSRLCIQNQIGLGLHQSQSTQQTKDDV